MGVEEDALAYGKSNSDQIINKFISDAEDHGIEKYQAYFNRFEAQSEIEANEKYDSIIGPLKENAIAQHNNGADLITLDSTMSLFNDDGKLNLETKEAVINHYKELYIVNNSSNEDLIIIGENQYKLFDDNGSQNEETRNVVISYYENQYRDSIEYKGSKIFIDGEISEIVKQKVISENEQNYLQDHSDDPTYPLLGISYQKCKNQQLGLGLDLQGGMSVTLEVDIPKLVNNLAGNPSDTLFNRALDKAKLDLIEQEGSVDFLDLFYARISTEQQNSGSKSLYRFFWRENSTLFQKNDSEQVKQKLKDLSVEAIDKTQRIIESRINKFGVSQPNIQRHPISGRLQIELPGAKDKNRVRKLLQSTASLEFWDCYHDKDLMSNFQGLDKKIYGGISDINGKIFNQKFALIHDGSDSPYVGLVEKESEMQVIDSILGSEIADKAFNLEEVKFLWMNKKDEYTWKGKKITGYALLAIEIPVDTKGKPRLDGEDIENAAQSYNQESKPSVTLRFKPDAAEDWENWTGEKKNKMIAIVMDDLIYSAPYIRTKISGGNTEISGGFETIEEAQDLANILKAGSLPAPAVIVDEAVVGPSLGEENIQSGLWSFVFAFILVLIYMIFYYNRAGLVANVALLANIFFIIGTLASLGAALTLPGIAGLVLTIGMSVDANVLIYERIKEELRKEKESN
jgi:SecD/SecF fusion protein